MILKKFFLIFLIFSTTLFSETLEKLEKQFRTLTLEQQEVARTAYKLGKNFNYGYTLVAIAWKESQFGIYMINLQDPSAGVFHNNINTVMKRHKEDYLDTSFQRNLIAQMLIDNIFFAAAEALSELEYWEELHKDMLNIETRAYLKIWASYNGGYSYNNDRPKAYAQSIRKRIIIIKKVWEEYGKKTSQKNKG